LPRHHFAEDGVRTAESLFGEGQVAAGHGQPDGRAGNHFAIDRHGRNAIDLESTEALEQLDIATPPFSEYSIRADHDTAERTAGGPQIRDEFFGRLTGPRRLEGQHSQMRNALTLE